VAVARAPIRWTALSCPQSRMDVVRCALLRETCLALAIGVTVAVGCGHDAPPGPLATRIATLDPVNFGRGFVDSLALAPDAGLAATGERGGQIRVWAATTGGEPTPLSLGDYRQAVIDLAFSPDGRLLASLGRGRESALRLWRFIDHAGAGEWVEAASLPVGPCLALRFDSTGTRLAVLCEREVLIVDLASQQTVSRVANPHREVLTAFDLSADGQRLVTAGHDGEVTVRDVSKETPVRSFDVRRSRRPYPPPRGLEPPEVWAVVVALSGDGSRAAAVTIEGTVYVWDVATGKQLFDHADGEAGGPPPGSLRFERDGTLLTTTGDRYGMRRIDVSAKSSRILVSGPNAFGIVAITDDATAFAAVTSSASGGRLRYAIEVWRVATAARLARD
jgi:WD40 repeat protein